MVLHGFVCQPLTTPVDGRLTLDDAAFALAADPSDLTHLTAAANHSDVVKPLSLIAQFCDESRLLLGHRRRSSAGSGELRDRCRYDLRVVAQADHKAARYGHSLQCILG